jgi:AsmA protein
VRVNDVRVGPAEGERAPFLELKRAEVRVAALRAIFSAGKDVEVRSAVIDGLSVNIVRRPDGTTNLERLQKQIAGESEKKTEPQKASDLSFLRIDHAELREGKVAFIDKDEQLAIQHLDVIVNHLRAGKPLEVVLKAAVLADKQNLELRLRAAPLPPSLMPTPTSLALHVDPPVDLAPLGPFAGKDIGLEKGTLDADFDAELGSIVPGGKGPTTVKGTIKIAQLRLQGAKPLDVLVDTDVKGDTAAGEMQIDKLRIEVGPAGISGHGRASGLTGPSPRVEGLEVTSHDLDPARLAAYYPPLRKLLSQFSGPIGLAVRASGTQAAQALELRLDFTPVKVAIPETMAKAAGAPMTVTAHVKGAAASGGAVRFDAKIDLQGADLRPGGSIDKAPGQRLDLALDGARKGERIELADLRAHILDDQLQGHGWYESSAEKATKKFDLQLASSHLDLDKMLLPSKTQEEKEKPPDPKAFAGLSGHAAVKIDRLRTRKQELTDIVADVTMNEDDVKVNTAQFKAFGGTATASGTEVRLAHPDEPFHVVARLQNVGLENLLGLATEHKVLAGHFNGDLDFKGAGELSKTLAGNVDGHILDGLFYGKDLVASVSGPLARSLPFGVAGKTGQGGSTSLGNDLPFGVTIAKGVARLKQPIKISRPEAEMSFSGGIRVDGELDLAGTIALAPTTIFSITGGKVKPAQPIPVNLRLIGPAWSPQVADLDLRPAVAQIVREAGSAVVGKALGVDNVDQAQRDAQKQVEQEAKNRLKGLFGK